MDHIPTIEELKQVRPDFQSIEFVDTGGFKAVYKVQLGIHLEAIKVVYIPPEAEENDTREEIVARVKREIDALKLCRTNRLVSLGSLELQLISISGRDYLIYSEEFLPGESLRARIRARHQPNYDELRSLTQCLMEALQAVSDIQHIHRDVKPGNVITTGNAERPFVLLDLGIAFKLHGTELTARHAGPPGTLHYMAPELFQPNYKDALDIRSDIYSAGITLYEYAAGVHPLARIGESEYTTIFRILNQSPVKLVSLRNDLPDSFCSIVDRCIKKLPALRFPNPKTVLRILEETR
jgi:serine/threonine-protein kinase